MTSLRFANRLKIGPPFVLGVEALRHLDTVVEEARTRLSGAREVAIQESVSERLDRYRERWNEDPESKRDEFRREAEERVESVRVNVVVALNKDRLLTASTLAEVMRAPTAHDALPQGITVELRGAGVSIELQIDQYGASVYSYRGKDLEIAHQAQALFFNWAKQYEAPPWQRYWIAAAGMQWLLLGLVLIVSVTILDAQSNVIERALRGEAQQLIENGLTQDEIANATEILLRHDFDLPRSAIEPRQSPGWIRGILFFGLVGCMALSVHTRFCAAIGKGAGRERFWRSWMRLVGVTGPGLLFGSFLWPMIENIIRRIVQ